MHRVTRLADCVIDNTPDAIARVRAQFRGEDARLSSNPEPQREEAHRFGIEAPDVEGLGEEVEVPLADELTADDDVVADFVEATLRGTPEDFVEAALANVESPPFESSTALRGVSYWWCVDGLGTDIECDDGSNIITCGLVFVFYHGILEYYCDNAWHVYYAPANPFASPDGYLFECSGFPGWGEWDPCDEGQHPDESGCVCDNEGGMPDCDPPYVPPNVDLACNVNEYFPGDSLSCELSVSTDVDSIHFRLQTGNGSVSLALAVGPASVSSVQFVPIAPGNVGSSWVLVQGITGKRAFDFQYEVVVIPEAVGNALEHLDPVVDALDPRGVYRILAVTENPERESSELPGEVS